MLMKKIMIYAIALLWCDFVNAQSPPNIVIIMADDLGYGDLGCYGARKIATPAVDSIAANGMRFTNAHTASSLCSPSRYSLLSGRYSWRTPLKSGVLTWFAKPLIEDGRTTLASMLKRNGYATACIGKWHLGFNWSLKNNDLANADSTVYNSWDVNTQDYIDFSKPLTGGPIDKGFDYFFGISASNNMIPFVYIENNSVTQAPTIVKEYVYDTDQKSTRAPNWDLSTIDETLTSKAVHFIDQHFTQPNSKPLFLYFPTSAIHRPCLPNQTKGKSKAGLRGDMVMEFDKVVSQVVAALKRHQQLNNTLLIITSDNGGVPGDAVLALDRYKQDLGSDYYPSEVSGQSPQYQNPRGNLVAQKGWITYDHPSAGEYLGFKSDAWEGGHRVPLIMRWPNHIKAGTTIDNLVCNVDLLATLTELVGDHVRKGEGEDSYSFLSNMLGKSARQVRKSLTIVSGGSGAFVAYRDDWKYIEPGKPNWGQTFYVNGPKTNQYQLYQLKNDQKERENKYASEPTVIAAFREQIERVEAQGQTESNK